MKKLLLLFMTTVLVGCSTQIEEPYTLEDEYQRIQELIPSTFTEDLVLPESLEGYRVDYEINNQNVENNTIPYTLTDTDIIIELEIKVYDETDERVKYYIEITNVADEERYDEFVFNTEFEYRLSLIESYISNPLGSNVSLPEFNDGFTYVTYESSCLEIENSRLIYNFPLVDTNCELEVSMFYKKETRNVTFNYKVLSINNLPKLPAVYITTDLSQPVERDKEYVRATLSMDPNGTYDLDPITDMPLQIRTRGNSTLTFEKPAFKIKFDEKIKFFSDYKEKDWLLLANYTDVTMVRNAVGFNLSSKMGMEFAPGYTFVDLYLNGDYMGTYQVSDQIEVTGDRVQIEENLPDIDTGYLIELDYGLYRELNYQGWTDENYFTIPSDNRWEDTIYVLQSPDSNDSHYSEAQKEYIKEYMEEVTNTIKTGQDYSHLIDDSTFIDWYIVNEIMATTDCGYSSVYFYKDKGGLLKMGPVWDMDLSSGNTKYVEMEPEGFFVPHTYRNEFLYYLMQYPEFVDKLQDRWNELYYPVISKVPDSVYFYSDQITESRYQNFERWEIIGYNKAGWYAPDFLVEMTDYNQHVFHLHDYLETRIAWLNTAINELD